MSADKAYDLTIIGAGPAGMTAAIFARNKGLDLQVVEGMIPGGQLSHLYPHKPVYNYPGYAKINGGQLADQMLNQLRENEIELIPDAPVERISYDEASEGFELHKPAQNVFSRSVIIAAGMGLLEPRKLNAEGEAALEGQNVFYTITDLQEWQNQNIIVVGGGNSAVDHALLLMEQDCRVVLIHQLNKFQSEEASVEKLRQSDAEVFLESQVTTFKTSEKGKVGVVIENKKSGETCRKDADRILINIGLKPNLGFINSLDLDKKGKQIKVDTEMQTSIAGVYACGDVVAYPGKSRLIVTAMGEAATAVNSIHRAFKSKK